MGVQKKQCYDPSGFPDDFHNFLKMLSDDKLADSVTAFRPGFRHTIVEGPQYTHHLDYEKSSSDGLWHFFSIAPDSGATKQSLKVPKGKTAYVSHIGISQALYKDIPSDIGTIARGAFLASENEWDLCITRYVATDGKLCMTVEEAVQYEKDLKNKKPPPTHAPNGKPYWNYETMGYPYLQEHYDNYETEKPKPKKNRG